MSIKSLAAVIETEEELKEARQFWLALWDIDHTTRGWMVEESGLIEVMNRIEKAMDIAERRINP